MNRCKNCLWWSPNLQRKEGEPERMCRRLGIETGDEFGCVDFIGPDSTEVNVPQHTSNGSDMPPDNVPVPGAVHILIVTYIKDLPWLVQCLRSLSKMASGFSGITVAFPEQNLDTFKVALRPFDVRLHTIKEPAGKGMLVHMVKMAQADLICPDGTMFVMHLDADCIAKMPITPEHYFTAGLPQYLYRSYESLLEESNEHPGASVAKNCIQWKRPTEAQLGFKVDHAYTMCRHPTVFPIEFYGPYRDHVEKVQGKPFREYMLSGRNSFPQDRMDFTAMGAFAFYRMKMRFRWIDVRSEPYPKDRIKAYWSHGGITPEIQEEIDGFLR